MDLLGAFFRRNCTYEIACSPFKWVLILFFLPPDRSVVFGRSTCLGWNRREKKFPRGDTSEIIKTFTRRQFSQGRKAATNRQLPSSFSFEPNGKISGRISNDNIIKVSLFYGPAGLRDNTVQQQSVGRVGGRVTFFFAKDQLAQQPDISSPAVENRNDPRTDLASHRSPRRLGDGGDLGIMDCLVCVSKSRTKERRKVRNDLCHHFWTGQTSYASSGGRRRSLQSKDLEKVFLLSLYNVDFMNRMIASKLLVTQQDTFFEM